MFGKGRGRGRGQKGKSPKTKECICPQCKTVIAHKRGKPCFEEKCPECGTPMLGRLTTD